MWPLAALTLAEKVWRHGRRIVGPTGVALILVGLVVVWDPAWLVSLVPTALTPMRVH
ncbi:hypothetical protein [Halomonas sp. H5]|uniref:hypothetical protein n=1 Tax=Halomonas sp. H5 TaxID=3423910 RepID=UPI003D361304